MVEEKRVFLLRIIGAKCDSAGMAISYLQQCNNGVKRQIKLIGWLSFAFRRLSVPFTVRLSYLRLIFSVFSILWLFEQQDHDYQV